MLFTSNIQVFVHLELLVVGDGVERVHLDPGQLVAHLRHLVFPICARPRESACVTVPWREAGPPNHPDDKVDSDQ